MINLDSRLSACARLVSGGIVIDVGTDHTYLPCFLIENGKCSRAYACDIAEGPLSSAQATVAKEGLADKVTTVLSDGLLSVSDEAAQSASDIVIAGMGGELIAEIIAGGLRKNKLSKSTHLILQPNTKAAFLRKFLYENGYDIISETVARDGKFLYTVMSVKFAGDVTIPDELALNVGRLDPRDDLSREYIEKEIKRLRSAAAGMLSSSSEESRLKANELNLLADGMERYIKERKTP